MKFLFIFSFAFCQTALAGEWSEKIKAEIDQIMAQQFTDQSQVGVVIGLRRGDETYVWSYGERVLGSKELPTGDTFFEMGSITKTFTATLLAKEVIEGNVTLSTKVQDLWPDLNGLDAGVITLGELATHVSGLPRMPQNFKPADWQNPYADYTATLLLEELKAFKQETRGAYAYSNLGIGLLGYLLAEKLHRQSYAIYLQTLLDAQDLRDTKLSLQPTDLDRSAQGYNTLFETIPYWGFGVLAPAGALKTTVKDLLKYARFQGTRDESVWSKAAALAQTPRATTDDPNFRVGLVWELGRLGNHSVITHGGATGGFRANLIFDQENGISAVILSNTDHAPKCALAAVFGVKCELPRWVNVRPEQVQTMAGAFYSEELKMKAAVLAERGLPAIQLEGQPKLRLWLNTEGEFKIPAAEATLVFGPDAQAFTLTQAGASYLFTRR